MATKELVPSELTEQSTSIPIGRRIREILLERKITPNSFYKKVGMGRGTFYDCLDGKRHITPSELRKIAEKLNLTVERIKQEDTKQAVFNLRTMINNRIASQRTKILAKELLSVAIGCTEKFDALNNLGCSYFLLMEYEKAYKSWLNAFSYAEDIQKRFNDHDRLYIITKNLIVTYSQRKDFSGMYKLLDRLEPDFEQSRPEYAGALRYSQGIAAYETGNKEECKKKMYESLEYYRRTNNIRDIGTSLHSVAFAEYELGNFDESLVRFEEALLYLNDFPEVRNICLKDYTKTLLALGRKSDASRVVMKCLFDIDEGSSEIMAKFLILQAYSDCNVESAKRVLDMKGLNRSLYGAACKFLMDHYCALGDSESLMQYYKVMGQHSLSSSTCWRGL